MAKYCPECRTSCDTASCPTDAKGRCARCGKRPVEASASNRSWVWCSRHDQWHTTACGEDREQHCCTAVAA